MNTRTGETNINKVLRQSVQAQQQPNTDDKAAAKQTVQLLDVSTTYFNIQAVIKEFNAKMEKENPQECLKKQVRMPETTTVSQCLYVLNYQVKKERKVPQKLMTAKHGELFVFSIDKKAIASAANCEVRTIERALETLFEAAIFVLIGVPPETKRGKKQDDYSVKIGVKVEWLAWFEVVKK